MKTISNRKAKQLYHPLKVESKLSSSGNTANYKIYIGTKFVP